MIYIFFSERLLIYFSLVNIELQPVLGSSSKLYHYTFWLQIHICLPVTKHVRDNN